jgi:hypothetical protein
MINAVADVKKISFGTDEYCMATRQPTKVPTVGFIKPLGPP